MTISLNSDHVLYSTKTMANTILAATVAPVSIGHLAIEGLLAEDGRFFVGVPQVADCFQFLIKNASRDLKALLSEDFQFLKLRTPLNPKAVNAISLATFEKVLVEFALRGNEFAISMLRDLVGLSLQQLFCDAFGIKFDADDRQEFLRLRQESKRLFWDLTQQIKHWIDGRECSQDEWKYYASAFDCLNLQLFGLRSKQIREQLELGGGSLNRDHFGCNALRHITIVQQTAAKKMAKDPSLKPCDAIKLVVSFNEIEAMSFKE